MSADQIAVRARRANGLPDDREPTGPLPRRLLTSGWTWITVGLTLIYAASLVWLYRDITKPIERPDGTTMDGIDFSAVREAFWYALPTAVFWIVLFLLLDRFRPSRPILWYLAFGWGAVSLTGSYVLNTIAGRLMNVDGDNVAGAARPAIYAAPFVEEALKATVLFGIAICLRYRLVTRLQALALAGLSAASFAFGENIVYYARAIFFASYQIDTGDPEAAVQRLVFLRGVVTAFGHPLFTLMIGGALIIALRSRSKVVRVLGPLVGYLLAAFLHMAFNATASLLPEQTQLLMYFTIALPLVITVVIYAIRQVFVEGRRIRERLADYVQMGWLEPADPIVFSRLRHRGWMGPVAFSRGWRTYRATVKLRRVMTELAHLRDGQVRGLTDAAGDRRARYLLNRVRELRPLAVDDPRGQKLHLPKLRLPWRRRPKDTPGPPGGDFVSVGASAHPPPLGSQQYTPVDPSWGPPRG